MRLELQLSDYFLRVRADQVKGNPKPAVDGPVQQAVGKGKEKTDRHQGKPQEGNHHLGFEPGAQSLLPALDVQLQQNAQ